MPLGDDNRRQKSKQHREAAFSRWESKGERAVRKSKEGTVDTIDGALGTLTATGVPEVGLLDRLMALFALVLAIPLWLWGQLRGTLANIWEFITWIQLDYFLPPSITSTINWATDKVWQATGLRGTDRNWQIAAAFVIIVAALLSSLLTAGLTLAIALIAAGLLLLGIIRFVPAANTGWSAFRSRIPVRDDYDAPLWSKK